MSNRVGALEGNVTNLMKQIEEQNVALESHIFVIRDNLYELTNFMKALLPSLGTSF
jgi:hypothetical protein